MDFSWDAQQLALKDEVIRFATEHCNGNLIEREQQGHFSHEIWKRCADFGIQGMAVPTEFGGGNRDILSVVLAMEAMGFACRDNGLTLALNAQMWTVQSSILHFGRDEQKEAYLRPMCEGTSIGAYAITEPDAGSDVFSLQTTAEKADGGYVLNGKKRFVTLGPIADFALVFAVTNPDVAMWGLSCFIVPTDSPGFDQITLKKMGLRTIPMGEITLRDCFVSSQQRLGDEGAGAGISNNSLEWERSCMLASQLGAMQRQLDQTVQFSRNRKQFGKPIGKFQAVSHRIAEMKVRLEAARLLVYQVAWLKKMNKPATMQAALAKLYLSEAYVMSSQDAIRVHGGHGYLVENEIERDLRDSVGGVLYGGTSDIQREIIARHLGL